MTAKKTTRKKAANVRKITKEQIADLKRPPFKSIPSDFLARRTASFQEATSRAPERGGCKAGTYGGKTESKAK